MKFLRHKRHNATSESCWHGGVSSDKPVVAGSWAISQRSVLRYTVDIAAFPRIDLKVDAARPIFAFSQPD
jgi:hypothetical protein